MLSSRRPRNMVVNDLRITRISRQGLLERSWLVGVLPLEILTSYILSQFLVIVMQVGKSPSLLILMTITPQHHLKHEQVAIALVVVFGVFQIPCSGSLPLFILLSLLQGE